MPMVAPTAEESSTKMLKLVLVVQYTLIMDGFLITHT